LGADDVGALIPGCQRAAAPELSTPPLIPPREPGSRVTWLRQRSWIPFVNMVGDGLVPPIAPGPRRRVLHIVASFPSCAWCDRWPRRSPHQAHDFGTIGRFR
jgi:hypothetical protein